jgi:hypothetical protein
MVCLRSWSSYFATKSTHMVKQCLSRQMIICNPYWFNLARIFNVAPASSQWDKHRLSLEGVNKPFRKIIQPWYGDIAISQDLVKLTNNCKEMTKIICHWPRQSSHLDLLSFGFRGLLTKNETFCNLHGLGQVFPIPQFCFVFCMYPAAQQST